LSWKTRNPSGGVADVGVPVGVAVGRIGVRVRVGAEVAVFAGNVLVAVGASVLVGVAATVLVAVGASVLVRVADGVLVGAEVAVFPGNVLVAVGTPVLLGVGDAVLVGAIVAVAVGAAEEGVFVGVTLAAGLTCGQPLASRKDLTAACTSLMPTLWSPF